MLLMLVVLSEAFWSDPKVNAIVSHPLSNLVHVRSCYVVVETTDPARWDHFLTQVAGALHFPG